MTVKKDKVTTKIEKEVLLNSCQTTNMLSRTLGIKESVVKDWLAKNRPNYEEEVANSKTKDPRTARVLEQKKIEEEQKKVDDEVLRNKLLEEQKIKDDEDFKKELEKARQNADDSAMDKLMGHKETDSKGRRRFVTIMTPAASERGDEYRKVITANKLDQPHIHKPKKG